MTQANVIYDSRNDFFKTPLGAVKAHTNVRFRILVSKDLHPVQVRMVMQYDRHEQPALYEMTGSMEGGPEADTLEYSVSFDIHDTGLYWYHFEILAENGWQRAGRNADNQAILSDSAAQWQQTVYQRAYKEPAWIYGGIYYHIFVDRFHKSGRPRCEQSGKITRHDWGGQPEWRPQNHTVLNNDFFGGDLEGIRQKLSYLSELHVTCLYLSPVFEAYSNHKYDTGDYEIIDPMFGTKEDFEALCCDAAKYNMRVICDGVFAHTGSDSRYFDKYGHYGSSGAYGNPDSPYRSWYFFHDDETYDCWWDFPTLPKLNKNDPGYIHYITGENGIVRKWLRTGASGWRLDVADELPNGFLQKLVAAAKAEKEDSIIVGEVWEDASNKIAYEERKNYFEGNGLDSVMNYPFRNAIIEYVRYGNSNALSQTVESIVENYPPEVIHCLMNVLGTHDSVRIITALAGKDLGQDSPRELQANTHLSPEEWARGIRLLKTASLIQMTLPGVPCIYYGDEAGTEGYKDPFNRTCFPWGQEHTELLDWYKKITDIRWTHSVYKTGGYRTVAAREGLFAFERFGQREQEASLDYAPIMTITNCGAQEHHLDLEGCWTDLLTGDLYEGTVTLCSGDILLLEKR